MKPSTLILLAAAALAFYFFVLAKKGTAAVAPATASKTPTKSMGEQTLETAIKAAPGLIGDAIGSLFGDSTAD